MTDRETRHAQAARELLQAVLPVWARHLEAAQCHADEGVQDLMQHFMRLRQLLATQALQDPGLQPVMDDILTALQFHDRLTQMLQLLAQDQARALGALQPDAPLPQLDPATWLQRLASEYVMVEQHQAHDSAPHLPSADTTTFF